MRFACVEFSTKTGRVWRHRPDRPNYLGDPEREIDPTSFACYTSALDGAHIPLTGLIYGNLERAPSRLQRFSQDLPRRLRGAFGQYDLSPLKSFDVFLVIYQLSNDDEIVRFVRRLRDERPDALLVSSSSPPFGRLREHWKDHREALERYRSFLETTHFNMNVCRATVPYYRELSPTPSLYLPQPYPVEYAASVVEGAGDAEEGTPPRGRSPRGPSNREVPKAAPPSNAWGVGAGPEGWEVPPRQDPRLQNKPRPIVYVAGDTVRPDIMTGHLVAKVLQQRHPELLIRVTKTPEFSLNTALLRGARYEVVPFLPWTAQLRRLAAVRLVINTDLWWTRGRVPVDCAAAGTPCVGTTSDGQTELWPDLAIPDSTQVDELVEMSERALSDETFRQRVVAKAQKRLAAYAYHHAVERLTRALELARAGRLSEWRDPVWEDDRLTFPEVS